MTGETQHNFKETTFSQFTYCDYCTKFLWGISHQGYVCQLCGYVSHPYCKDKVLRLKGESKCQSSTKHCQLDNSTVAEKLETKNDLSLKTKPLTATLSPISATAKSIITESREDEEDIGGKEKVKRLDKVKDKAEQFLKKFDSHKEKELLKRRTSTSLLETSKSGISYSKHSQFESEYSQLFSEPTTSLSTDKDKLDLLEASSKPSSFDTWVKEVIDSASVHKNKLSQARQQASPALNIFTTTPHNFSKFISRITPIRELWNTILSILTWENQLVTWVVVLTYATVCLRPVWVLLLPHIGLWYYLTHSKLTPEQPAPPSKQATLLPSLNVLSEQLSSITTQEYAINMQFVQNVMGIHVECYDTFNQLATTFLSTNGFETCLYVTLIGFPLSLILFYLIPLNWIVLALGLTPILANHPLVLALIITLIPRVQYLFYRTTEKVVERFKSFQEVNNAVDRKDEITITVFENQRWWMVLGWSDTTFHNERSAWSDASGTQTKPPIYCINPLPNYQWKESSDSEAPSTNGFSPSGWKLVPIVPEQDVTKGKGWVYYDHRWHNATLKIGLDSVTRRRAWSRTMVKKSKPTPQLKETTIFEGVTKPASSKVQFVPNSHSTRMRTRSSNDVTE